MPGGGGGIVWAALGNLMVSGTFCVVCAPAFCVEDLWRVQQSGK